MQLTISPTISEKCPGLVLGVIECEVRNSLSDIRLWEEMDAEIAHFRATTPMDQINKRTTIAATRMAYKALGKDPNRYRPSAEALCRRVVREMELYRINTLVDLINLVSIRTGYSIGGFDADKIEGGLILTVGTSTDEFEAIGRGLLNIEGLPLYKDSKGGIGTPTSDNERTKLSLETRQLLMIINAYDGEKGLHNAVEFADSLLQKYANAVHIQKSYYK